MILLMVVAISILKLGKSIQIVSVRLNTFMDSSEKEIVATIGSIRKVLSSSDLYINSFVRLSERYMAYRTMNRFVSSPKLSKVMMGVGLGYGLVRSMTGNGRKKK
jgi:hypothetical protein